MEFNRPNVSTWMRRRCDAYRDEVTGEVDATALAEAAAAALDANGTDGPLDDEQHWIWELALKYQ